MYFADLSAYSYDLPRSLPDVLNVGWLDAVHSISMGEVPADFRDQLRLCVKRFRVNQMRGFHACELCPTEDLRRARDTTDLRSALRELSRRQAITAAGEQLELGSAELWLPAGATAIFAAPNLIVHYIEAHGYRPPSAFISAVAESWSRTDWNAQQVFEERTAAAFR